MPPEIFPPGLTVRGATHNDIPTVAALLRTSEEFDAGEPSVTVEDVESEWMLPDFDPAVDVLLVFEDDRAIASAEVPGWRAEATVHPDARGRGIGTAILEWIERRAVERADARFRDPRRADRRRHRCRCDLAVRSPRLHATAHVVGLAPPR